MITFVNDIAGHFVRQYKVVNGSNNRLRCKRHVGLPLVDNSRKNNLYKIK